MTASIRSIETHYRGVTFRSKLESEWAMTFDNIGIAWEYETKCFQLPDVGWYKPDFYFPTIGQFFEVKGVPTQRDLAKWCALIRYLDRHMAPVTDAADCLPLLLGFGSGQAAGLSVDYCDAEQPVRAHAVDAFRCSSCQSCQIAARHAGGYFCAQCRLWVAVPARPPARVPEEATRIAVFAGVNYHDRLPVAV